MQCKTLASYSSDFSRLVSAHCLTSIPYFSLIIPLSVERCKGQGMHMVWGVAAHVNKQTPITWTALDVTGEKRHLSFCKCCFVCAPLNKPPVLWKRTVLYLLLDIITAHLRPPRLQNNAVNLCAVLRQTRHRSVHFFPHSAKVKWLKGLIWQCLW